MSQAPPAAPDRDDAATPMMAQFLTIKEQAGDALLFYRMGDFYELFFEDAEAAARALDITLTRRGKHRGQDIPMCGVPVVTAETYLSRLIAKGFRVAVCEQVEDPKEAKKRGAKSVVARAIVRVVTPGTITEDTLLDARRPAWLAAIASERPVKAGAAGVAWAGIAWADITTGRFETALVETAALAHAIAARAPRELVHADAAPLDVETEAVAEALGIAQTPWPRAKFDARSAARRIAALFEIDELDGLGTFDPLEVSAAGALIEYLAMTQAGSPPRLDPPRSLSGGLRGAQGGAHSDALAGKGGSAAMAIDPATRASLELERTQRGERAGSLLAAIDRTVTGPGARALAGRLAEPSTDLTEINARLDACAFLLEAEPERARLREALARAGDGARALSRLVLRRGGPRDLIALASALAAGEAASAIFASRRDAPAHLSVLLDRVSLTSKPALQALRARIAGSVRADAPPSARDGGFIERGVCPALDAARDLRDESRRVVAALQAEYAEMTGVSGLKIKHNHVLGYFIETPAKAGAPLLEAPLSQTFIHRQTMATAVRFSTVRLAGLEAEIAGAGERAKARELELFEEMAAEADAEASRIRALAAALADLDAVAGLASWAQEARCVRPLIDESRVFQIEGGRHPVVEAALARAGESFTPNPTRLDGDGQEGPRLTLVTGPNMAGKSTYLRQNALMAILAQAGAFVPAQSARIGVVDRVFSRVGAADDLARGRSTFMAEMIETAAILNQAGPRALVILDEIGRGTSTFDGLAIAWACVEHLHDVIGARTLFATHYHELTSLAEALPAGANVSLRAKEWRGALVFLHDVRAGPADRSYGVEVARRAGLPRAVVARANAVLKRLETEGSAPGASLAALPLFACAPPPERESDPVGGMESTRDAAHVRVRAMLEAANPDTLSPRDALDLVYALREALAEPREDGRSADLWVRAAVLTSGEDASGEDQ